MEQQPEPPANPLLLTAAEYKAVFDELTRLSLEYLATINERPTFPSVTGDEARAFFAGPCPEEGIGPSALAELEKAEKLL